MDNMDKGNLVNKVEEEYTNNNMQNGLSNDRKDSQNVDEFASTLPQWNLEPPTSVIKRVKRVI